MPGHETENIQEGGNQPTESIHDRVRDLEYTVYGNKKVGNVGLKKEIEDVREGFFQKIIRRNHIMIGLLLAFGSGVIAILFKLFG